MPQLNKLIMNRHKLIRQDHNPIIYFAFKLPNHISQFITPSINELTSNKQKIDSNPN